MKILSSLILITILAVTACHKPGNEIGIPACIENMITDFKNNEACNTGANVKEFKFQGNTVFVFDPGSCGMDLASPVVDSACTSLGFLGGIAGITKINGEEFSNATFIKIIWEN
jgi:hypothetical protein